jgi:hypothetical protein
MRFNFVEVPCDRAEIDVLEIGLDRIEARPRRRGGVGAHHGASALQARRDDRQRRARRGELFAIDDAPPDLSAQPRHRVARLGGEKHAPLADDGEVRAEIRDVVDDVRREDHDHVLPDVGEEVVEAHALLGIESRGGLVDDDELGVADQRLGDAEALAHAPGEPAELLLAHRREVGALEERVDRGLARLRVREALQPREVVEHLGRGHLGIDAELLGKIAEEPAHAILVAQHVDVVEGRRSAIGLLQRGERAHEGRLARAVRAEEAEHPGRDGERHVVEGLDAIGIALREIADGKLHWGGLEGVGVFGRHGNVARIHVHRYARDGMVRWRTNRGHPAAGYDGAIALPGPDP